MVNILVGNGGILCFVVQGDQVYIYYLLGLYHMICDNTVATAFAFILGSYFQPFLVLASAKVGTCAWVFEKQLL